MSCAYLTDLATAIWNDLGQPSSLSVAAIQAKLISQNFLGQLNALTSSCYSGVSGYVIPALGSEEQGIYAKMYEKDYWTTRVNQTLAGTNPAWTTIQEADSRITRVSTVEQSRIFKDMQKQASEDLIYLLNAYNRGIGTPKSVDYPMINFEWEGNGGGRNDPAGG